MTTLEHRPVGRTGAAAPTDSRREYAHLDPLVARYTAMSCDDSRRRALREELVAGFFPVVEHIARRYRDRGEPTADLEQVGAIGLLGALERFDPSHGADFMSFAVPTITGEIRRHFRDRTWAMRVPRRLKDLQGPVRDAIATLSSSLGRAPRPSEIAAHLGHPVADVVEALNAQYAYSATSLDGLVGGPDSDVAVGDALGSVDAAITTAGYRRELRDAFAELPDRERTILALRFFEDLTQTQIAARVGLSQMHVSRLLQQSLLVIRQQLSAR